MIAACLLYAFGIEPGDAFALIATARGCAVPDTEQQREWIKSFIDIITKNEPLG